MQRKFVLISIRQVVVSSRAVVSYIDKTSGASLFYISNFEKVGHLEIMKEYPKKSKIGTFFSTSTPQCLDVSQLFHKALLEGIFARSHWMRRAGRSLNDLDEWRKACIKSCKKTYKKLPKKTPAQCPTLRLSCAFLRLSEQHMLKIRVTNFFQSEKNIAWLFSVTGARAYLYSARSIHFMDEMDVMGFIDFGMQSNDTDVNVRIALRVLQIWSTTFP